MYSSVSATFVSSSVLLIDISPTSIIIFTLSGNNNWGDTKSNFMRHESSASGRRSDAPAPASGGSRKYALLNGVFFCLLVCSKLNLTCRLFIDLLFPLRHFSVEYLNIFGTASTGQLVCLCCHQTIRISYAFILRIVWASYASLVTFLILLFMYRKRLIVID